MHIYVDDLEIYVSITVSVSFVTDVQNGIHLQLWIAEDSCIQGNLKSYHDLLSAIAKQMISVHTAGCCRSNQLSYPACHSIKYRIKKLFSLIFEKLLLVVFARPLLIECISASAILFMLHEAECFFYHIASKAF